MTTGRQPRRTSSSGRALQPFHYTASGLSDVWLVNGFHIEQTPDGPALSIEDADGLHDAIARSIVTAKRPIGAAELRYLRKLLGLSQANVARLIGVSDQTIARWEKAETVIDPAADRLIRFVVLEHLGEDVIVRQELAALAEQDEALHGGHRLQRLRRAWRRAA